MPTQQFSAVDIELFVYFRIYRLHEEVLHDGECLEERYHEAISD